MELQKLEAAAREQLIRHGLHGWTFRFTTTKRRLGVCNYRAKRIEIAEFYALNNPEPAVHDTLLHEIAHALAGPKAAHGPAWKAVAERIGASPRACDNSPETVVEPGDWQTTCPACQRTHHRYRRPRTLDGYRCRCPAKSPLVYSYVGDPGRMPPPLLPSATRWQARCGACGIVHRRVRRPKPGLWHCGCPQRGQLTWAWAYEPIPSPEPAAPSQ
jgi:predicted SprT family Zn-dependent metalloprotease